MQYYLVGLCHLCYLYNCQITNKLYDSLVVIRFSVCALLKKKRIMVQYSNAEKFDIMMIYGECRRNARAATRLYRLRYPNRRRQPNDKTFKNLATNLMQYGSFQKSKRDRLRTIRNNDNVAQILQTVENNPTISLRNISEETGISYSSCQRMLSDNRFHPFKATIVHHLRPDDYQRRLDFLANFSVLYEEDNTITKKILWTDESRFHNNGVVNMHNCHYWSDVNPNWTKISHNQNIFGINVWCGILDGNLIGPYFYEGKLNGQMYLNFLQNELPELLENISINVRRSLWFQ
uniref:DUF4817 domain-containing protein n=1 Tax=Anoplophora glabripennis TaxID=217634 RepID=V5GSI1_ANOGL